MHDDGEAAVVARVLNQSSLYYDADPVPSEEMAAASGLNAAASTTTTSATAAANNTYDAGVISNPSSPYYATVADPVLSEPVAVARVPNSMYEPAANN
eukprot:gene5024-20470_t